MDLYRFRNGKGPFNVWSESNTNYTMFPIGQIYVCQSYFRVPKIRCTGGGMLLRYILRAQGCPHQKWNRELSLIQHCSFTRFTLIGVIGAYEVVW